MRIQIPNLKLIIALQIGFATAVSLIAVAYGGVQLGASTAYGAFLMLANLILLAWAWARVLNKKSVAWTILILVIKYAVLLGSIFYLARAPWFNPLGAGVGMTSFLMAALVLAVVMNSKNEKAIGSIDSL